MDVHYEDLIRAKTGGVSTYYGSYEIDAVTDDVAIQAKRVYTALDKPKNFKSQSVRDQIKATLEFGKNTGRQVEYWFKYGVSPEIRSYLEDKGIKVITGLGDR